MVTELTGSAAKTSFKTIAALLVYIEWRGLGLINLVLLSSYDSGNLTVYFLGRMLLIQLFSGHRRRQQNGSKSEPNALQGEKTG